jgi:hypothetical protein
MIFIDCSSSTFKVEVSFGWGVVSMLAGSIKKELPRNRIIPKIIVTRALFIFYRASIYGSGGGEENKVLFT